MNVQDYCRNVELELSSWKSKLESLDHKIQSMPSIDKYRMLGNIEGLHIILTEMDDRIMELQKECPTEWNPIREEVHAKLNDLEERVDASQKAFHDYDFGG